MTTPFKVLRPEASVPLACLIACASPGDAPVDDAGATPTFEALYALYFAPGTPGHCATAGCHGDPGHNVWRCVDAHSCYQGMLEVGLIDANDPARSAIVDPHRSPLTWINSAGGDMPLDAQGVNAEGRAAIEAWVHAGCVEK